MKAEGIKSYFHLLKTLLTDYLFSEKNSMGLAGKKRITTRGEGKDGAKKAFTIVFIVIGILFMLGYLVMNVSQMTVVAIQLKEISLVPYALMGMGQLFVVFFGMGALFGFLYFSEDNVLLQSLPISSSVIFAAKFTLAYLSQLVLSLAILLPAFLTFGITASLNGVELGVGFYVLMVFTPFVSPLIPLLAITVLSVPVTYLLSFVRNKMLAKNILTIIMTLASMAVYLLSVLSVNSIEYGENGEFVGATQMMGLIGGFAKFSVFNYNWIQAMMGNNVLANVALYLAYIIVAFVLILFICRFTYKRSLVLTMEDGRSTGKKRKSKNDGYYGSKKVIIDLIVKDTKMIVSEPTVLLSALLSVILVPVITVLMSRFIFPVNTDEGDSFASALVSLGIVTYVIMIVSSASNYISLIGISLEGKNFSLLKSLPIRPREIISSKLIVSSIFNLIIVLEFYILYVIFSGVANAWAIGLLNAFMLLILGFGNNCLNLRTDLKKPTLLYESVQKLTKNNFRVLKPIFISLGIGIVLMIVSIIASFFLEDEHFWAYIIYFAVSAGIALVHGFLHFIKLWKNMDEMYEKIEC